MATPIWRGGVQAVQQVDTVEVTAVDGTPADNAFVITIGGVAVSVPGDTDTDTTAENLRDELAASVHPYFKAIEFTVAGSVVTLTGKVPGVPFVAEASVTGGGSGTIGSVTSDTPATGPNHWDAAGNWDTGVVPTGTSADTVHIPPGSVPIRWGISQSGVTLVALRSSAGYSGEVGLRHDAFAVSSDGYTVDPTVTEYRETHLTIKSARVDLGIIDEPTPSQGCSLFNLDLADTASVVVVHSSGERPGPGHAVNLLANSASTAVYVRGGDVGVATLVADETSTVGTLSLDGGGANPRLRSGAGTTVTNWQQLEGMGILNAAATVTLINQWGGRLRTEGNYTVTAANLYGGECVQNHIKTAAAAITTATVDGGHLNCLGSREARTITNLAWKKGRVSIPPGVVTITTPTLGDTSAWTGQIQ